LRSVLLLWHWKRRSQDITLLASFIACQCVSLSLASGRVPQFTATHPDVHADKQVFPSLDVVGWYATTSSESTAAAALDGGASDALQLQPSPSAMHLTIHENVITRINESPVLLLLDPSIDYARKVGCLGSVAQTCCKRNKLSHARALTNAMLNCCDWRTMHTLGVCTWCEPIGACGCSSLESALHHDERR
jgi:hypothetical protein